MNNTDLSILRALNQHGEIHGTETLCQIIGVSNKKHVLTCAVLLAKNNMIERVPPLITGKGHKTIYRDKGILKVQR